jgi:primosomal protein N' (replication factor Y)
LIDSPETADRRRVPVLFPLPLDGSYDYLVPEDLELAPGAVVTAPLGGREACGVVWDHDGLTANPEAPPLPDGRLKEVRARLPAPPLSEAALRFIEWVAAYYIVPTGRVLRMALSMREALRPPPRVRLYRLADAARVEGADDLRLTPARRRVLEVLADGLGRTLSELARLAGVSSSVVKGLERAGIVEALEAEQRMRFGAVDWSRDGPLLSATQAAAAEALRGAVASGGESVTLLDGVTGSGKTEVYFEAVAECLSRDKQALVLLPEIALSTQWLDRFTARFGAHPGVWHSDLGQKERRETWRAVAEQRVQVVVGARSALFLPYQALGLIVVDEEHDPSYKQEDGVPYNARDMAVVRGRLEKAPVILASATPSLESLANVERGRYRHLLLEERHGGAVLPQVELVDLRRDRPLRHPGVPGSAGQSWLSTTLRGALSAALAEGEQALLFLNRRGYAPLTLCRACGHRIQCPHCTAWLVEHRLAGRLQCHHCGFGQALPAKCPACAAPDTLAACGPGVERLAEEVKRLYPDARQALMASDTMHGPAAAAELIAAVEAREVDILIGTQIAAKGYHFPYLTLVWVIDGDLGLYGGDLRAAERTFQLLQQVAGRAGRADCPGRVLIQTTDPDHPVMRALADGDRERFIAAESGGRKRAGLPPYGRLAALILSAPDQRVVDAVAGELARAAPGGDGVEVLGPAPAPLAILRGRHRRRFLLRTGRGQPIQAHIRKWLSGRRFPAQLRLQIDVDPQSFL